MVAKKRNLLLYVPVIHQGYLDLFESKTDIEQIYLIDEKLVSRLSQFEPTIAALSAGKVKAWLQAMGIKQVRVLTQQNIIELKNQPLLLINDQVGRALHKQYFAQSDVELVSVFLRWDRDQVLSQTEFNGPITTDQRHVKFIQQAYQLCAKSGDWWRQIGALAVKGGRVLLTSYNQGMSDDHTPYQEGGVRDYLKVGERPELANLIHAEQSLIARAAAEGISLKNSDLYVTHFPCPVCAKLIAMSGIKRCFFAEGSSVLDGLKVMTAGLVEVMQVKGGSHE
ncbi:hypothetical protein KKH50_04035 [Patescibacteria group bacterium]|nr:hypothetical protein [Patescibacteria group bacterium]